MISLACIFKILSYFQKYKLSGARGVTERKNNTKKLTKIMFKIRADTMHRLKKIYRCNFLLFSTNSNEAF